MRRAKMILGTVLAASLLGTGSAASASRPPTFTGEQLFTGLFLAQGPAAEAYPDLRLPQAGPTDSEVARRLTDRMNQLAPGFFSTFEANLTSGDRLRIQTAAQDAGNLAIRAADKTVNPRDTDGTFMVVDKTIIKVNHVVVNKNKYWVPPEDGKAGLSRERWVNDVAETLAR